MCWWGGFLHSRHYVDGGIYQLFFFFWPAGWKLVHGQLRLQLNWVKVFTPLWELLFFILVIKTIVFSVYVCRFIIYSKQSHNVVFAGMCLELQKRWIELFYWEPFVISQFSYIFLSARSNFINLVIKHVTWHNKLLKCVLGLSHLLFWRDTAVHYWLHLLKQHCHGPFSLWKWLCYALWAHLLKGHPRAPFSLIKWYWYGPLGSK